MSESATPVTPRHQSYLAEHTRGEDAFLADLKRAAQRAGIPAIWISPAQASLMQVLLKLARAERVVEVGTLAGYSAIALARALPSADAGGRLDTIELEPAHASFAEEWIGRSDVADRVRVHRGAGRDVLPRLPDRSADAVFLDADKPGYAAYVQEAKRLLRPGGMLLVDNAFAFGRLFDETADDRDVEAVRTFNDRLAADADFHGSIVAVGDGLWVAVLERGS